MKRLVGALVALLAFTAAAQAQTYPTRTITLLVGFPPGGPTDTLARILADGMKSTLGQSIAVETVSGASGTIATGRVVHAAPDGYTIGIGNWTSHVGSPALYPLDYDVFKDLQPIALLAASPLWILGKSALPPKTASELIAWLKARTEPTTFATVGAGSDQATARQQAAATRDARPRSKDGCATRSRSHARSIGTWVMSRWLVTICRVRSLRAVKR